MRLINTHTLALEEFFFSDQMPRYAILSHTWQDEEVSFQDWANQALASKKKGYKKIRDTCLLAKSRECRYLWVDTNCIDKSSSAELSEAINSMFKWYRRAEVCYVYLSDVPAADAEDFKDRFRGSRWFKRGWTLQELLAPSRIEFYSHDWKCLEMNEYLQDEIPSITGINAQYLPLIYSFYDDPVPLRNASVGERLSWLSGRETTREEDMAYCMLGIFDLNMPLLYGEGSKAFTRLQEEILKVSDDHSLFCWTWREPRKIGGARGFLSEVPSEFKYAGQFFPKHDNEKPSPYTLTNAGLHIQLPVVPAGGLESTFLCILRVDCGEGDKLMGLPMSGDLKTGRAYRRSFPPEPIPLCPHDALHGVETLNMFVSSNYKQRNSGPPSRITRARFGGDGASFTVLMTVSQRHMFSKIQTYPPSRFDYNESCIDIFFERDEESPQLWESSGLRFVDDDHMYEAVLVQCETWAPGDLRSFIVAVRRNVRDSLGWRWHSWGMPPHKASQILEGKLDKNSPLIEQVHMAIKDPKYAQRLDVESVSSQGISMAKEYLLLDGGANIHRHVSNEGFLLQKEAYMAAKAPENAQTGNLDHQYQNSEARQYSIKNCNAIIHMHLT